MSCFCKVTVVPPKNPCSDCLQVNDVLVGCADGPPPCGEIPVQIDLGAINDLTACTGTPVWSIKDYDELAFTNVEITQDGIITFETTNYYKEGKDFIIRYQVDCPGSIFRAEAEIKVCMKNPCPDGCKDCNPCTAACFYANNGEANATITSEGCSNVVNSFDLKTISSYADCGTGVTYDLTYSELIFSDVEVVDGVISFVVLPAAVSGATYVILYKMTCPDFGYQKTASLTVTVKTKCHDVVCAEGEQCDECTGLCGPIPPEVGIGGAGSGHNLTIS